MVSVNPLTRDIQLKIVYYGPGLGGKTTTLQHIHDTTDAGHRGTMVSLATPVERTLYFDYLPMTLPKIGAYTLKLQLFTVPGQIHFNATRKLVLSNADGVVFVADSQRCRMEANLESFDNLLANLSEYNVEVQRFPILFQYNKRDLVDVVSIDELQSALNRDGRVYIDTCAIKGENVYRGLELITREVLRELKRRDVLKEETPISATSGRAAPPLSGAEQRSGPGGLRLPVSSPLEDAVSRIMEEDRAQPPQSQPSTGSAASSGGAVDRPTIPAPFALTEKNPGEQNEHGRVLGRIAPIRASAMNRSERVPINKGGKAERSGTPAFSFLPYWPKPAKKRAVEIENAISAGRHSDAMHLITAELNLIIAVHSRGMPRTSPSTVVAMLGLDDRQFKEIQRLTKTPEEALTRRTVLGAYLFLLLAVDRSR